MAYDRVTCRLRAPTVVYGAQWVYSVSATYSPNTTIGASNYINLFPELKEHGLHLRVSFFWVTNLKKAGGEGHEALRIQCLFTYYITVYNCGHGINTCIS